MARLLRLGTNVCHPGANTRCSCRRTREEALEGVAARGRELERLQLRAKETLERADAANRRDLEQADQCLLSIHVRRPMTQMCLAVSYAGACVQTAPLHAKQHMSLGQQLQSLAS